MKKQESYKSSNPSVTRRRAIKLAAVGLVGTGSSVLNSGFARDMSQTSSSVESNEKLKKGKTMIVDPSKKVQYEEMFPEEMESVLKEFPVAYVPFGSLEWHGRHLPYGTDSLKVHGILTYTAQKYGGVVVPTTYWGHMGHWKLGNHPGLSTDLVDRLFIEIFTGLVRVGFRVVIGVTGHDVRPQVDSLQKAVKAISSQLISPSGRTIGFAMMEGSLNLEDTDVGMDHAAKWETSIMMALKPELVDMNKIKNVDRRKIESGMDMDNDGCGISGKDPRIHASKEVGEKAIEKITDKIGQKARELLRNINWDPSGG